MQRAELVRLIARERVARRPPHEKLEELPSCWAWSEDEAGWELFPVSLRPKLRQWREVPPPNLWRDVYDAIFEVMEALSRRPVRNEYLLLEAAELGIEVDHVDGQPLAWARCPCCGYRTLELRGDYDICPVCKWEDDFSPDEYEDTAPRLMERYSGPDHMTRLEYRRAWEARRDEDLRSGDPVRIRRYEQFAR